RAFFESGGEGGIPNSIPKPPYFLGTFPYIYTLKRWPMCTCHFLIVVDEIIPCQPIKNLN
ncbi:hypothetical protein, partial [Aquitalea palustris]|uniref:hypothetical protein n=1 Tax=Aquitalea palustris TaxID=2480983 RepID=UPI001F352790